MISGSGNPLVKAWVTWLRDCRVAGAPRNDKLGCFVSRLSRSFALPASHFTFFCELARLWRFLLRRINLALPNTSTFFAGASATNLKGINLSARIRPIRVIGVQMARGAPTVTESSRQQFQIYLCYSWWNFMFVSVKR